MTDRLVIKIGGSLLTEPRAMRRVADWLDATRQPHQVRVLIAGGGSAVDALRAVDRANPLSEQAAHWGAVAMMDAQTALLSDWVPGLRGAKSLEELLNGDPRDLAFACSDWLQRAEPFLPGEKLRIGWRTTSDAIAARLAEATDADLLLLKHTLETTYDSVQAAADAGVVDSEAPRHTASLPSCRLLSVVRPELRIG